MLKSLLKNTLAKLNVKIIRRIGGGYKVIKVDRLPLSCRVGSNREAARFLTYDPDDSVQRFHLSGKYYELNDLQLIRKYYRPGTFIDIGANVGNHTIFMAKTFPDREFVCFEPHPRTYGFLYMNLVTNELIDRVHPVRAALSNRESQEKIRTPRNNIGGSFLGQSIREILDDVVESWTCDLKIGDDALKSVNDISFIKIDVEGHECECLEGLGDTIRQWRPDVYIEVSMQTRSAVEKYFADIAYELVEEESQYTGIQNLMFVSNPGDNIVS